MNGILLAGALRPRTVELPRCLLPVPGSFLLRRLTEQILKLGELRLLIGTRGPTFDLVREFAGDKTLVYRTDAQTTVEATLQAMPFTTPGEITLWAAADTYLTDEATFVKLAEAVAGGADVALGILPLRPGQTGNCLFNGTQIVPVLETSSRDQPTHTFLGLAWRDPFWQCFDRLDGSLTVGLSRALDAKLKVQAVLLDGRAYECAHDSQYFECVATEFRGGRP